MKMFTIQSQYGSLKLVASALLVVVALAVEARSQPAGEGNPKFERHQFTVQRIRGMIYVDGFLAPRDIVAGTDQRIDLIEKFDGLDFQSDVEFRRWARTLRGRRTYTYDDVVEVGSDGKTTREALVLLPHNRYAAVKPAWNAWLVERAAKRRGEELERKNTISETRRLEAIQQSIQANDSARQVAESVAVDRRGGSDLWNLYLVPRESNAIVFTSGVSLGFGTNAFQSYGSASGFYTQVTARNSLVASQIAVRLNPGYRIAGAVRSRRRYY